MDIDQPLSQLGGLSARLFVKRHWQRKPLLVRGAVAMDALPLLSRAELFAMAGRDEVESRLIVQAGGGWKMRRGPLARRALPPVLRPQWTLLVQGADLQHDGLHRLLQRFRFLPDARLDDLMVSYATDGGGVGPHFDSYDVFLLQAQGRRRWRIGRQRDLSLQEGMPLKILANFTPAQEFLLEPGDMLYLPPRYAHEGVAEGECQTYSIGFRSPGRGELGRELLERLAEDASEAPDDDRYRDGAQAATGTPAAIPAELRQFAQAVVLAALDDPIALDRVLGEYLTEPPASLWFEARPTATMLRAVVLDRRTRMMHDPLHVFVNGESWRASGRDAAVMHRLADERRLGAGELARASDAVRSLVREWCEAGWLHETGEGDGHDT